MEEARKKADYSDSIGHESYVAATKSEDSHPKGVIFHIYTHFFVIYTELTSIYKKSLILTNVSFYLYQLVE